MNVGELVQIATEYGELHTQLRALEEKKYGCQCQLREVNIEIGEISARILEAERRLKLAAGAPAHEVGFFPTVVSSDSSMPKDWMQVVNATYTPIVSDELVMKVEDRIGKHLRENVAPRLVDEIRRANK